MAAKTPEEIAEERGNEMVQARRKEGYGTVTLYSPAPPGERLGADDGQPLGTWAEGQCIAMRRAEAESRDDCEVVEPAPPAAPAAAKKQPLSTAGNEEE